MRGVDILLSCICSQSPWGCWPFHATWLRTATVSTHAPVSIAAMQQSTQRVVSYSVLSLSKNVHDAKTPKLALVFSLIRWFWALKPKNPPPILIPCLPVNLINSYLQLGNMWDVLSVPGYEKGKHDFSLFPSVIPASPFYISSLCFWSTIVPCSGLIF